ncbi:MAG: LysR family transcriptional regulator [Alsobacter sp.]
MDRDLLPHLPVVMAVARLRGFAAAAASLNMSASAVSHAVRTVEDRIGEPLFARTTRSVGLTEAGQRFLATVGPALDDIGSAFEILSASRGEVSGLLRINAPRIAFPMALTAILARTARDYPGLTVETHANDAFVDIVAEGFDAGVRLGAAVQQDMIAVRITRPFQAICVASPAYLEARGRPNTIADLARHNLIGFRMTGSGGLYEWELRDGERDVSLPTKGTAIVTDATFARDLALADVGIAYVYEPLVRGDLLSRRLVRILPDTAIEEDGLFLYFVRRAQLAPKFRAFLDAAKDVDPA